MSEEGPHQRLDKGQEFDDQGTHQMKLTKGLSLLRLLLNFHFSLSYYKLFGWGILSMIKVTLVLYMNSGPQFRQLLTVASLLLVGRVIICKLIGVFILVFIFHHVIIIIIISFYIRDLFCQYLHTFLYLKNNIIENINLQNNGVYTFESLGIYQAFQEK